MERRRDRQPSPRTLSVAEQREITALAEANLELPPGARDAAEELARMAPPQHVLRELGLSGLVAAEPLPAAEPPIVAEPPVAAEPLPAAQPLPDRERNRHGS